VNSPVSQRRRGTGGVGVAQPGFGFKGGRLADRLAELIAGGLEARVGVGGGDCSTDGRLVGSLRDEV
jgi:hypothetical protein